jgi:hypothetical protein
MKRYLCLLFSVLLFGCGGGSGDSATAGQSANSGNTPVKANAAPVLVGQLSMQLTAMMLGESNFALQDSDNDSLTVTYLNKPSWVDATVTTNQLKLSVRPGLFQVGTTSFTVRVSDGKTNSDYNITLNVADDPTKWVQMAMLKTDFIGQWSLSTGDDLHLYDNDKGRFFASDGSVYALTWSYQSGAIDIRSTKIQCVTDCVEQIQAYVIATEGSRKRLVLASDQQKLSVTVSPYTEKTLKNGYYVTDFVAVDFANKLENNNLTLYVPYAVEAPNSSLSAGFELRSQVSADGKIAAQANVDEVAMSFYQQWSNSQTINLRVNLTSAEIIPSASDRLTLKYQLEIALVDSNIKVDQFIGLKDVLTKPLIGFVEVSRAEKIAVPKIVFNTPYFAGYRFKTEIDGKKFENAASELVFTDATRGIARIRDAGAFAIIERNFTWTASEQELIIKLDGKEYPLSFMQHPVQGVSLITATQYFSPFLTRDKVYESKDLLGSVALERYSTDELVWYHNIFADNTAQLFATQAEPFNYGIANYLWQQESDGSMTLLRSSSCDKGMVFTSCAESLQRRLAQGENVTLTYRNFKIVQKTAEHTYVQSSYSNKTKNSQQYFESVVRWMNVKN